MNVHVSLNPAVTPAFESAKVAEPNNPASNFSHALNAASEAAETQTSQDAGTRGSEKRQQKRSENPKDASQAPDTSGIQPAISQQAFPVLPVPGQTGDQPVDEETDGAAETIASNLSTADNAASAVTTSVGQRPVRIANPIISTTEGGSNTVSSASSVDDGSAAPVEDASGPASGAVLAASDEASAPLPGADPASLGLTDIAKGAPPKSSLLGQDAPVEKDQPILAQGDSAKAAAPVSVPPIVLAPIQPVPVSLYSGPDLSAMTASAKPAVADVEGKEISPKPVSAASNDRAGSDVHGRRKTDDSDADSQSGVNAVSVPAKFSVSDAASAGQRNDGQNDAKDVQPLQAAQVALTPPTNDGQTAQHNATAASASDVPAPPVPTAAPAVAEGLATPTLSGARLLQSVHQSEMKLGINSAEFGNISISTSVTHQALSAQISLDHYELGRALVAHLPAMEEKLSSAYGLAARVEVSNGASSSYAGSSQHSSEGRQNQQALSDRSTKFSSGLGSVTALSTSTPALETSRLDIRI